MDNLGTDVVNTSLPCRTETEYECRAGAVVGQTGLVACYGDEEVCNMMSNGVLECVCRPGFCLEGTGSTATCHKDEYKDLADDCPPSSLLSALFVACVSLT